jgi:hypothetical protein
VSEDIANAIAFLASDVSAINGIALPINAYLD